jgi:enoyl-CoA hydratase/carnithine racemase
MTAEVFSGVQAHELGRVGRVDDHPAAAALQLAEELKQRSPDQLAAAKRLFNDTWTSSPRRTFARERMEQAFLLFNRNTKVAREAALSKATPVFAPRSR